MKIFERCCKFDIFRYPFKKITEPQEKFTANCQIIIGNMYLNYYDREAPKCNKIIRFIQGTHFSGDTKFHVFSRLFPGKCNEIPGQFGFEAVFVLIIQI